MTLRQYEMASWAGFGSWAVVWRPPVSEQSLYSARLNLCWCVPEACKYKKRHWNGGHDEFLLNCNIDQGRTQRGFWG